jgi:putative peptide zinc metalloprotease protein
VRRADGQTIQLTPVAYGVLEAIDGLRDHDEIAGRVGERIGRLVTADDVRYLVDEKLRPLGVLKRADGSDPAVRRKDPLLALRLRKVITNPRVTRLVTAPFAALFYPPIVFMVLLAFGAVSGWLLFDQGLAAPAREALYQPGRLLLVFALAVLSAGFHEFGHAAAATYGGVRPGAMGVGLYLVWPVFYTDVTEAYRLPRRDRLRVDVGGLYFNAVFAVASIGIWALSGWDSLLLLVPVQIGHMVHQLLPFVRFDGYHILADLTGVPDLFAHVKPTLRHLLPTHWFRREPRVLKPGARLVVSLWVLVVVPLLATILVGIVVAFPRLVATAWDSVRARWELLLPTLRAEGVADAAVVLLSIAFVALPVAGAGYLMVRVVRRTSRRVWRGTTDRPVLRGLAVVAAIGCAGALAFVWWPDGQYRPIAPEERGTAFDLASVRPARAAPVPAHGPAAVPTAASPRLAYLLTPQDAPEAEPIVVVLPEDQDPTQAGAWVFPFDPPAAPGEGDNQALAVNTVDGTTIWDVSIAVVWVTDDQPVDSTNEAWALASCSDCQAVAVAYEAVFIVGQPKVIVPQNIAVAVTYGCDGCQTAALAGQLVVTLADMPGEEAMAELADLQGQLEALGDDVGEVSLEQIYAELERIEAAIVQVLIDDGSLDLADAGLVQVTTAPSPAPSTEPTPTVSPTSPSPSSEPSESPSPDPSPSPSPDPSESPSPEPSSTDTASPSPAG